MPWLGLLWPIVGRPSSTDGIWIGVFLLAHMVSKIHIGIICSFVARSPIGSEAPPPAGQKFGTFNPCSGCLKIERFHRFKSRTGGVPKLKEKQDQPVVVLFCFLDGRVLIMDSLVALATKNHICLQHCISQCCCFYMFLYDYMFLSQYTYIYIVIDSYYYIIIVTIMHRYCYYHYHDEG